MKTINSLTALSLVTIFMSCGHERQRMSARDLISYSDNEENGFVQEIPSGELVYSMKLKTADYMLARDLTKNKLEADEIQKRRNEIDKYVNLTLRISSANKGADFLMTTSTSEQDYHLRNMYYSYEFNRDICLISGIDSIRPAFYQFVNYQGLAPFADIELAFNRKDLPKDGNIVISVADKAYNKFSRFVFKKELLLEAPEINI